MLLDTQLILNPAACVRGGTLPKWTRDYICNLRHISFAGLRVGTQQYGFQNWFETAYQTLSSAADRAWVRKQKLLAGDSHIIVEFFTNQQSVYPESDTWLYNAISPSMEQNPGFFYQICREAILDNLIPVCVYDGDNGDNPNDGYPNALRQIPLMYAALKDLNPLVVDARFWDGVWYGSSRDNIVNFGKEYRKVKPNGCLAMEGATGVCHLGDDVKTFGIDGLFSNYDIWANEFDYPTYRADSTWQVLARTVEHYHRPSDEPPNDDPTPQRWLGQGTYNSRGAYYNWPMECGEYNFIHENTPIADLKAAGDYFRSMGAWNVGLP